MIHAIVLLTLYTFIPALELRFSIPMGIFQSGIKAHLSWPMVVVVCMAANMVLGWGVFFLLGPVFTFVRKWGWFDRRVWPVLERTRHRVHPYVERYGEIGVAVFIGIPLPGSGVYTGAFGAYLLGMKKREFAMANIIGVLIAGAAVTALCLLILHGAVGDDSWLAKLFLKIKA